MIECFFTLGMLGLWYVGFAVFMIWNFWKLARGTSDEFVYPNRVFGWWLFVVIVCGVAAMGFVLYTKIFMQYGCV